jgi:hypothetical protein
MSKYNSPTAFGADPSKTAIMSGSIYDTTNKNLAENAAKQTALNKTSGGRRQRKSKRRIRKYKGGLTQLTPVSTIYPTPPGGISAGEVNNKLQVDQMQANQNQVYDNEWKTAKVGGSRKQKSRRKIYRKSRKQKR